jgi:amino acid transporter
MTAEATLQRPSGDDGGKGLKTGAIGLLSSVVIGVASTAPAYSLAVTLGLVVGYVGAQAPIIVILAFVPILFVSIGYQQLNKREPDCGTTFTWATKAFGPKTGWMGGWGILAADILVMASLAQVAGQYVFLLFDNKHIGNNPASGWVLFVGLVWMVVMTYICYRGIEISARIQQALLSLEVVVLIIFAVTALFKAYGSNAPSTATHISGSWFNPFHISSFSTFSQAIILMLFIYWGWDSAVSVNEETKDRDKTPGRAAVISTVLLLATYVIVTIAAQSYAGVGSDGIGLAGGGGDNGNILSTVGSAVFGNSAYGKTMSHLLIILVLTSAAACTQTTILPTARTTLSMAAFKAIPERFAHIHKKYLTPTQSTIWMGIVSAILYVALNFQFSGGLITDAVTAIGIMIAFYYGLTGFACAWYYRHELQGFKNLMLRGVIPFLGGVMLFGGMIITIKQDWSSDSSEVSWHMQFAPHWVIGFAFILGVGAILVGFILMFISIPIFRPFFSGQTLNRDTPIFLADDAPITAGLTLPDSLSQEATVIAPDFSNLPSGRTATDPETGETYRAP